MASPKYEVIFLYDAATGAPYTGALTLTFDTYKDDLGNSLSQPTISALPGGDGAFGFLPVFADPARGIRYIVDTGTDAVIPRRSARYMRPEDWNDDNLEAMASTLDGVAMQTSQALSAALQASDQTTPSAIADAVWNADTEGRTNAGTFGQALVNASAPSAATVATAVWSQNISGAAPNTAGAQLNTAAAGGGGGGGCVVQFYSNGDTVKPIIVQVSAPRYTQVIITYSEPVTMTTGPDGALNVSNYLIPGLTVLDAAQISPTQVSLTTTAQTPDFLYTITVQNVTDIHGNAIQS